MTYSEDNSRALDLGLTSVVLGTVALLVFFMPILGLPLSAVGLALGLVGALAALRRPAAALRWPLAGVVICLTALALNAAIDYWPEYEVTSQSESVSPTARITAPPPAK
jgi:hypothetical protein